MRACLAFLIPRFAPRVPSLVAAALVLFAASTVDIGAAPCQGGDETPLPATGKESSPVHPASKAARVDAAVCVISAEQAVRDASEHGALLIDLRGTRAYQKHWIPGAVTSSWSLLPRDPVARTARQVRIIGDDLDYQADLQACMAARQAGMGDVRVVAMGMRGWRLAGGRVAGVPDAADQAMAIDAAQFHRLVQTGDLRILAPGSNQYSPTTLGTVTLDRVDAQAEPAAATDDWLKRGQVAPRGQTANVLWIEPDTAGADRWRAAAVRAGLYVYSDGLPAYQRYVAAQQLLAAAPKRPPPHECGK